VRAQAEVRDAMRKLTARGVTVILVTHHLPDIIPEINRVIALRDGRIFSDGPKEGMLTAERMGKLFGIELRVERSGDYYDMRPVP